MSDFILAIGALLVVGLALDMRKMVLREAKYRSSQWSALLMLVGVPQQSASARHERLVLYRSREMREYFRLNLFLSYTGVDLAREFARPDGIIEINAP